MAVAAPEQQPRRAVPRHVAVIMDGNGRWAEQRGKQRPEGHKAGYEPVRTCIQECVRHGVGALTLFAFSSENWKRPADEVGALMKLFMRVLDTEVDELARRGVCLRFIGERGAFAAEIRERMARAEALTAGNATLALTLAVGYGGRWDITRACRELAAEAAAGRLDPAAIDEAALAARLGLAGLPEPDLFIRTGGDMRISNFLLWHLAYTELWFTEVLWPDVDEALLDAALSDFARRERRFGLTSAQVAGGAA